MKLKTLVPRFAAVPLIFLLCYNILIYCGTKLVAGGFTHYDLTTRFDEAIPLVPWMVVIYLGCYIFWGVNYILSARFDKISCRRFVAAEFMGKTVCMMFFIFMPTIMTRPEITGNSIFDKVLRFVYMVDTPVNLFPSIHCYASWFCFMGIRSNKRIPVWYRVFSLAMAIAVCVSTVTVKQHVIADVFAGVILAEICWFITGKLMKNTEKN